MSNALRHLLGAVAGVVLTLLTWIGFGWASQRITMEYQTHFAVATRPAALAGIVLILVVAAGLGLATSARFASPIAALIPGVVFLVLGLAIMLAPGPTKFLTDMSPQAVGTITFGLSLQGVYPLLGVLLIVSAIPPHRWRAARPVPPRPVRPGYGGYSPGAPAPAGEPGGFPAAQYPGAASGPGVPGGSYGTPPSPAGPYTARSDIEPPGGAQARGAQGGEERPRPPEAPPAG